MGAAEFGRERVAIGTGRATRDAVLVVAGEPAAASHDRSSVIGPSTQNTPRSWSVTIR